ncbi:nose resistant to fluoxetine protein 6 isoform X2 [Eurytemora carolleeae]|uniref:nose resistant to fluoxetine protein 6 isoform X1 n=1 Tax=Eurytemora carolleeae TaxID=1294199 RepID=UPI000C780167|nr:nose resistant to fluoxetine protein 6 isoform X1 [Eurytemora carolleeae]XP_023329082.1 nose resistant to fluoxetine protein 6 isoform X2 [Eurytemora carolleeae]|eukprot:XP_023329081.1 nose resistant to fluoxetine protein 6-like isoform X1 [Eurytemora affinis]
MGKYCEGSIGFRSAAAGGNNSNEKENDVVGSVTGVIQQSFGGIKWGVCIPDACVARDLTNHTDTVLSDMLGSVSALFEAYSTFRDSNCFTRDKSVSFDWVDIMYTVIISSIGSIVLLSTIRDLWKRYGYFVLGIEMPKVNWTSTSTADNIVAAFSLSRNGSKLLDSNESPNCIRCIHGMRFISMTWVIFGHGAMFILIDNTVKNTMIEKITENIEYQVMLNAYMAVDTFFFLSGFLLCYLLLKELERNSRHGLILFNTYLHRYLRLTPAYLAVIGFLATLRNKMFIYPPNTDSGASEACRDQWWKMILYIHTLFDGDTTNTIPKDSSMCMAQSWYLSVDMQMFLIGPPLILCMFYLKKRKTYLFYSAAMFITLIFTLIPGIITWIYDFAPTDVLQGDKPGVRDADQQHNLIYKKPWSRAVPFIIGIWLGFWFNHRKGVMPKMNHLFVVIGWIVAISSGILIEYGMFPYNKFEAPTFSTLTAVVYATLHRPAWSLCLCWVIVTCHAGYGGPINNFLSWPAFVPLSRLTYSAYLVHYIVIDLFWYSTRPMYKDELMLSWVFLSNVVVSLAFAVFLALLVEIPVINLDKILIKTLSGDSRRNKEKIKTEVGNEKNEKITDKEIC